MNRPEPPPPPYAQSARPPDPVDAPPPRLFTGLFWAMMVFAAACLAGSLIVATLGPRLFVAPPANRGTDPANAAAPLHAVTLKDAAARALAAPPPAPNALAPNALAPTPSAEAAAPRR